MKKALENLTYEELEKVYENNDKLQSIVTGHLYDMAMDNALEIVGHWPSASISYALGYDRGAFFSCLEPTGFIRGLLTVQEEYELLSAEYEGAINECVTLVNHLGAEDEDEAVVQRIDELTEELAEACHNEFLKQFIIDDAEGKEYFCEVDAEEMVQYGEYYVDDEYVLYEVCTKKYN